MQPQLQRNIVFALTIHLVGITLLWAGHGQPARPFAISLFKSTPPSLVYWAGQVARGANTHLYISLTDASQPAK